MFLEIMILTGAGIVSGIIADQFIQYMKKIDHTLEIPYTSVNRVLIVLCSAIMCGLLLYFRNEWDSVASCILVALFAAYMVTSAFTDSKIMMIYQLPGIIMTVIVGIFMLIKQWSVICDMDLMVAMILPVGICLAITYLFGRAHIIGMGDVRMMIVTALVMLYLWKSTYIAPVKVILYFIGSSALIFVIMHTNVLKRGEIKQRNPYAPSLAIAAAVTLTLYM